MELFDVLDSKGNKKGYCSERGIILKEDEYYGIVNILVLNGNNEFLVTKRHPNKPSGNMWETTGGGMLAGESKLEAAKRELEEETGIISSNFYFLGEDISDIFYVHSFLVILDNVPEIKLQDKETVEYKWIKKDIFLEEIKKSDYLPFLYDRANKYFTKIEEIVSGDYDE